MGRILPNQKAVDVAPAIGLAGTSEDHDRWFQEQVAEATSDGNFVDDTEARAGFDRQRARLEAGRG